MFQSGLIWCRRPTTRTASAMAKSMVRFRGARRPEDFARVHGRGGSVVEIDGLDAAFGIAENIRHGRLLGSGWDSRAKNRNIHATVIFWASIVSFGPRLFSLFVTRAGQQFRLVVFVGFVGSFRNPPGRFSEMG